MAEEVTDETYIERCEFLDIGAVHFVIHGILGAGVSSSRKMDSLGKVFSTSRLEDLSCNY